MTSSLQSPFVIELTPFGFTQTLAQSDTSHHWVVPLDYAVPTGPPAEVANIDIGGTIIPIELGSQTIEGKGSFVKLSVELGACTEVTISCNPHNKPGCPSGFPVISRFVVDGSDTFQVVCTAEPTSWRVETVLEFSGDPGTVKVALEVNGTPDQTVPLGSSSFIVDAANDSQFQRCKLSRRKNEAHLHA